MRSVLKSRRGRATAAAVATAAALVTMIPLGAGTAVAAEPPAEVVLPVELSVDPDAGKLPVAGLTGFVQGSFFEGYNWFSFAEGRQFRIPFSHPVATDTDVIASFWTVSSVRLFDPATRTTKTVTAPGGQVVAAMMGRSVVTYEKENRRVLHLLTPEQDGTSTDRSVTLPEGATEVTPSRTDSPYGLFVTYKLGGVAQRVWIDRAFTLHPVDFGTAATGGTAAMAGRYFLRPLASGRVQVWDLAGDLSAPLHELDWAAGTPVALLGDHLLARVPGDGGDRLVARPLAGGAEQEVLDRITGDTRVGPDGRVIAARSGSGTERTVHSVRAGENGGAPVASKAADIPLAPTRHWSMLAANGVLQTNETLPWTTSRVRERELTVSGGPAVGPMRELDPDDSACPEKAECSWQDQTGDGRTVFGGPNGETHVVEAGQNLPGTPVTELPRSYGPSRRASGRYISYFAYLPQGNELQVADLDTKQILLRRPDNGNQETALVGGTLWHETLTPGVVDVVDVRSGAVKESLKVSDCNLSDLQVWGSHLYWACSYDNKAAVRDLTTGTDIAVPEHDFRGGQLGDGYLTHVKGGVLSLTPLRGGGPTRVIGDLSRYTGAWTVDRFGGHVYYSDTQERIHVVPTGIPAADLSVLDSSGDGGVVDLAAAEASWTGKWWLSKPAASWKLTVRDRAGAVVRTLTGGEARGLVKAVWDGKGEGGAAVADGRYGWELTAVPADGVGGELRRQGEVFLTRGGLGTYEPVAPARVLNTLAGIGAPKAQVGPGKTVTVQITGRGGVPETGVTAVTMNVTATNPTATTFVSAYPYGTPRPATSNLNVTAGKSVPNLVTVPVKDGKVTLYNHSGSVDLLADVAGYYTLGGDGDRFAPVAPARVLNTLGGVGAPRAKVAGGTTVTVQVAGRGGVPAAGVTAVTMNVTATNPTATTFVSAYPYGTPRPATSNLNVVRGQTAANLVTVPVKDGRVTLYNHSGSVDLLADVAGYFTGTAGQGDRFKALAPARVLNTLGKAKVAGGAVVSVRIAGQGGVPADGVSAVVMNVTATNPTATTFVAVYPYGTPRPATSNLNVVKGQTVANLVVVPVKDGRVTLYNHSGSVDLLADVAGYYTK
ncbi:FlgD immunoglobulin-like domain containing protein [Streptomyces sp. NPDC051921]|uniref:FlgD immunoglobulin-like domain containing protein n=1 Tax=Streptomyces sp. NPDC051921 TaxID=3155806 RepID=UPI003432718B